jgi:hypothetical protein
MDSSFFSEDDRPIQCEFLRAMLDLVRMRPSARRFNEEMYELAFILHRYSGAGYDVLRQILPLPDRRTLQRRFRHDVNDQIQRMTDVAQIAELIQPTLHNGASTPLINERFSQ